MFVREDVPQRLRRDMRVMHELNSAIAASISLDSAEITILLGAE